MSNYTIFEAYLDQTLTEEELNTFNQRLSEDAQFKSDFEMHMKSSRIFDMLVEEDVKAEISRLQSQKSNKVVRFFPYKTIIGAAASIMIMFASYFYLKSTEQPTNQELVADNYTKNAELETERSDSNEFNKSQLEIEFEEAVKILIDDPKTSSQMLIKLREQTTGSNQEIIEWNLAMAYLQDDNVEACLEILNKIASDEYYDYFHKANVIIDYLK